MANETSGNVKEVTYRREDGVIVHSIAVYSYRSGPIGEWMVGDKKLSYLDRMPGKSCLKVSPISGVAENNVSR